MWKYFILLLPVILLTSDGLAKSAKNKNSKIELSTIELKQAIEKEKKPTKRFYLMNDLVEKYASEKITSEMVSDVNNAAELLLKESVRFKNNWSYGNAVHHSHLVLGRLFLLAGNIEGAKKELKLAGQTPGSPQLNSFGPNMTLTKDKIPNFKGNLVY